MEAHCFPPTYKWGPQGGHTYRAVRRGSDRPGNRLIQKAHLVLGWDSGRFKATDIHGDCLPVLSYDAG